MDNNAIDKVAVDLRLDNNTNVYISTTSLDKATDCNIEQNQGIAIDHARLILSEIGIPKHIPGYHYIIDAVVEATGDMGVSDCISNDFFSDVAKRCGTTIKHLERSIRYTIKTAWTQDNADTLEKLFGYTINPKSKPVNREFVSRIASELQSRLMRNK